MSIKLYSKSLGELPIKDRYAGPYKDLCFPGAEVFFSKPRSKGSFYFIQQFRLSLFTIRYYCFYSIERDILTIETDQPSITFRIGHDRSHEMVTNTLGKQIFHERDYNMFYEPTPSVDYPMEPYERYIFTDLLIENDYSYYLLNYFPAAEQFLEKADEGIAARFSVHNQVATTEIWRWQEELQDWCYYPERPEKYGLLIGNNLIESCIKSAKPVTEERAQPLSIKEANRIYDASEIILNSTGEVSIDALAKKLGLSTTKLKEGFQEIYGHSIIKHRFEDKMLLALRLVNSHEANLKLVASTLGYQQPSVFEKDFKKRFGFEPF